MTSTGVDVSNVTTAGSCACGAKEKSQRRVVDIVVASGATHVVGATGDVQRRFALLVGRHDGAAVDQSVRAANSADALRATSAPHLASRRWYSRVDDLTPAGRVTLPRPAAACAR